MRGRTAREGRVRKVSLELCIKKKKLEIFSGAGIGAEGS